MDRERLYDKLDIDSPEDFKYYENLDALLEDDEHIDEELIAELFKAADKKQLAEHLNDFFESFLGNIPDDETELYIIAESFRRNICGAVSDEMEDEAVHGLTSEIYRFRRWYALDSNAVDESSGDEMSIRDARYEILAAGFLGEDKSIDFGKALTSGPDSYGIKLSELASVE